jgi:hypothetical protein
MSKTEPTSTPQSSALTDSWERQLKALDERLRASGRTVTVMEPSETQEFLATVPRGRRSRGQPRDASPKL